MFKTEQKCFIARPRRFGKTLMLSAIKYLYLGDHELFEGLEIYKYINRPIFQPHPVIYLDMSDVATFVPSDDSAAVDYKEVLSLIETNLLYTLNKIAESYCVEITQAAASIAFSDLIYNISSKHGKVVILIDEYDSLLTGAFDKPILQRNIHEFLRDFYRNIKTRTPHIHIAYITG
jgi:hypothetical protein